MGHTTTTPSRVKHVGDYTFEVKAGAERTWLWIVLYRGEHLNHGWSHMWSIAEHDARQTIAQHAQER